MLSSVFLAVALVSLGGYTIYDKSNNTKTIQQQETKIASISDEKATLRNQALMLHWRLDSMATVTTSSEPINRKRTVRSQKTKKRSARS